MTIGVHDFEIPHDAVQPTRDMVIIRVPFPPEKVGRFYMPDMARDIAQHNVQAGRVVSMGPLAFTYKTVDGAERMDVKIGDWVVIRPFAGTMLQGGKLSLNSGYRYVSSHSDVLGVVPSDRMPDPDTLLWDATAKKAEGSVYNDDGQPPQRVGLDGEPFATLEEMQNKPVDVLPAGVRERTVYAHEEKKQ
jgi:co-chaperonin GroES (HSP10)